MAKKHLVAIENLGRNTAVTGAKECKFKVYV